MHKIRTVSLILLLIILSSASVVSAQDDEIAGLWQSIGYGLYFDIEEDAVDIYQVTEVSCLKMLDVPEVVYDGQSVQILNTTITGIGQFMGTFDYELTLEDGLLNFELGKVNPLQAERVDALPSQCASVTQGTPENTFEAFWNIFNEHYAFFELRGVDWQAAYETYRPTITPDTTEEELFAVFQEMVAPLGDGHVSINTMLGSYTPIALPEWLGDVDDEEAIFEYAIHMADAYLIDAPTFTANDGIIYGKLSERVGYISILTFDGTLTEQDGIQSLADSMAAILDELGDMDAIVVDVRINFGGEDTNGFFIAGYFTDEDQMISSKSVWFENEFHPIMDVYIEPTTDAPYTGDVYLLTSRLTISAAETFALAMRELDNVTLVGEPTNGMLSDSWFAVLPNGWIATLSNERYLSADNQLFEGVGVPPDVAVTFPLDFLEVGTDPVIERVLEELTQ